MSKKDSWLKCEACDSEFKIFSDSDEEVSFCPYCGYELENLLDEDSSDWNIDDIMEE